MLGRLGALGKVEGMDGGEGPTAAVGGQAAAGQGCLGLSPTWCNTNTQKAPTPQPTSIYCCASGYYWFSLYCESQSFFISQWWYHGR